VFVLRPAEGEIELDREGGLHGDVVGEAEGGDPDDSLPHAWQTGAQGETTGKDDAKRGAMNKEITVSSA
jgi:hypothetical protein